MNYLYYGDNLDVLRKYIDAESVDLCYIDPPFNSKRNYNQIYNNIGSEDKAQAQAFIDTWEWNSLAEEGYAQILENYQNNFTSQTISLIRGLKEVLGKGSLLAYLVSITLRIVEIHRVLKNNGSFFLHCDPTSSHYLKLAIDTIFCPQGGDCINEIIWCYKTGGRSNNYYPKKHDTIFWYSKSQNFLFNDNVVRLPRDTSTMHEPVLVDENGKAYQRNIKNGKEYRYSLDKGVLPNDYWIDIQAVNPSAKERLGYPTQKPLKLLERIIKASTNEGDVVLDAYCGCGTTVAVAQQLNRNWIGIDITYQSISLILKRIEDSYGSTISKQVKTNGIPKDISSATALANRDDDRTRKEFEKWAILTYSNNRGVINNKKGADKGIDGYTYFLEDGNVNKKVIFQVKSGNITSRDIRDLHGTIAREGAVIGIFITLKPPTSAMRKEANESGIYQHKAMARSYPVIQIVSIKEILEENKRIEIPLNRDINRAAEKQSNNIQLDFFDNSVAV